MPLGSSASFKVLLSCRAKRASQRTRRKGRKGREAHLHQRAVIPVVSRGDLVVESDVGAVFAVSERGRVGNEQADALLCALPLLGLGAVEEQGDNVCQQTM